MDLRSAFPLKELASACKTKFVEAGHIKWSHCRQIILKLIQQNIIAMLLHSSNVPETDALSSC